MSARARIIGWMLLVVAAALAGSVLVTARAISVQADEIVNDEMTHEAMKFRAFAASPAAQAAGGVDDLLAQYLRTNLAESTEAFFTVVDGRPQVRSGTTEVRLDTDRAFVAEVAGMTRPTYGWRNTPAGRVRYAVFPTTVAGDPRPGALVVVELRDELARPLSGAVRTFATVSGIALVAAAIASWLVAGRVLAPIRLVRQTAEQISESDLQARIPVTGTDDVARVATTFNRMLDRLEMSFANQRAFLDDAGHELRTPITVIRGHLELIDDDETDREATLTLVTDELARMSRIVEDLLLLARSEQPDFLNRAPVNLTDLTVDALAHARMLGERQWSLAEVEDSVVVADGQRLTQALMQLAANAVQHTEVDDRISLGSRVEHGRLLLWVSDTGIGIPPAEQAGVFERFHRGGSRRGAGSGLGLAIVATIAQAHGGTVDLQSTPDEGATFVLDLPVPDDVLTDRSPDDPAPEAQP